MGYGEISGFAPGPKVPQFQGFLQLGLINIIRSSWLCHMYFRTATFFAHCIVVFIRSLPEHGVFAAPLFSSGNHFQPYLYALSVPLSSTLELNQASSCSLGPQPLRTIKWSGHFGKVFTMWLGIYLSIIVVRTILEQCCSHRIGSLVQNGQHTVFSTLLLHLTNHR